jgi:hypothetical protein
MTLIKTYNFYYNFQNAGDDEMQTSIVTKGNTGSILLHILDLQHTYFV